MRVLGKAGIGALALAATAGLVTPSAAGARTRGKVTVVASGMGPTLCPAGGQVVRIG